MSEGYLNPQFCFGVAVTGVSALVGELVAVLTHSDPLTLQEFGWTMLVIGLFLMPLVRGLAAWYRKGKR